jgi:transposase
MATIKRLRDLYGFPGFVPLPRIRGIFADPLAVVITLQRRREKTACAVCGQVYRSHYDKRPRRVRDLSCGDKRVYLVFPGRRVQCSRCGVKNERLDWLADNPLYTKRFAFFVGRRGLDHRFGHLA